MPQVQGQHIHAAGDLPYGPPVLRAPSPASSIGSHYGRDRTTWDEAQLDEEAFARKCQDKIGLGEQRHDEVLAMRPQLLSVPKNKAEEQALFNTVLQSLRKAVQEVQDNELLEQTILRNSQTPMEDQPSSDDIDLIMKSMMLSPARNEPSDATATAHMESFRFGQGMGPDAPPGEARPRGKK